MPYKANKELKLYYSISEVAQMFNVAETLLRFWEKEFPQISPKRSEGNHRLYTQNEIEQIKVIKYLLHEQKMKIEGAKILFEKYSPEIVVITQGKKGGIIFDGKEVKDYPAFLVDAVDSNGSGDVFHGAFAAAMVKGYSYMNCCLFASATSAIKCTGVGARESVPSEEEVLTFLRDRGIEL